MAEERERVRRQLALDTKRRQRLFELKAKEREAAEEELVRAYHSPFPPLSPTALDERGPPLYRTYSFLFPCNFFFSFFITSQTTHTNERSSSPTPIPLDCVFYRPSAS